MKVKKVSKKKNYLSNDIASIIENKPMDLGKGRILKEKTSKKKRKEKTIITARVSKTITRFVFARL